MYELREVQVIKKHSVSVRLPDNFPSDKAEIVITPYSNLELSKFENKHKLPDLIYISKIDYASQIILEDRQ